MAAYEDYIQNASARLGGAVSPDLLRAMMATESSGVPDAVSDKGALGLFQIMPATGAGMGLSPEDLLDPEKNINAGADYVLEMIQRFNDPILGLAAYNAGPGPVTEYGGVPPYEETREYVRRVAERHPLLKGHPTYKNLFPEEAKEQIADDTEEVTRELEVQRLPGIDLGSADPPTLDPATQAGQIGEYFFEALKSLAPSTLASVGSMLAKAPQLNPANHLERTMREFFKIPGAMPEDVVSDYLEKKAESWHDEGERRLSEMYLRHETSGGLIESFAYGLAKTLGENPDIFLDAVYTPGMIAELGSDLLKAHKSGKGMLWAVDEFKPIIASRRAAKGIRDVANEIKVMDDFSKRLTVTAADMERNLAKFNSNMARADEVQAGIDDFVIKHMREVWNIRRGAAEADRVMNPDRERKQVAILSDLQSKLMIEKQAEFRTLMANDAMPIGEKVVQAKRVGTELATLANIKQRGMESLPMDKGSAVFHKLLAVAQDTDDPVEAAEWVREGLEFYTGKKITDKELTRPFLSRTIADFEKKIYSAKENVTRGSMKLGRIMGNTESADEFEALTRMELDYGGVSRNDLERGTWLAKPGTGEPQFNGPSLDHIIKHYKELGLSEEQIHESINGLAVADRYLEDGAGKLAIANDIGGRIGVHQDIIRILNMEIAKYDDFMLRTANPQPELVKHLDDLRELVKEAEKDIGWLTDHEKIYKMGGLSTEQTIKSARLRAGLKLKYDEKTIATMEALNQHVRDWTVRAFLEKMYDLGRIDSDTLAKILIDNRYYALVADHVEMVLNDGTDAVRLTGLNPNKWLMKWEAHGSGHGGTNIQRLIDRSARFSRFYLQEKAAKNVITSYNEAIASGKSAGEILKETGLHFKKWPRPPKDGQRWITIYNDGKPEYYTSASGMVDELLSLDPEEIMGLYKLGKLGQSVGHITRAMRTAATATGRFIFRAPIRDILGQWPLANYTPHPFKDLAEGLIRMNFSRKGAIDYADPDLEAALAETLESLQVEFWGKGHGASFMQGMNAPQRQLSLHEMFKGPVGSSYSSFQSRSLVERALYPMEMVGKAFDVGTRAGVLGRLMRRAAKGKGLPVSEATNRALQPRKFPVPDEVKTFGERLSYWQGEGGIPKFIDRLRDTQDPTLNFNEFGTMMRGVNTAYIFANATAKEMKMIHRAMQDHSVRFFARGLMPLTAYAGYMWATELHNDPEWNELPTHIKAFMIPLPGWMRTEDGRRYAIPVPQTIGFLFWTLPILTLDALAGKIGKYEALAIAMRGVGEAQPLPFIGPGMTELGRELASPVTSWSDVRDAALTDIGTSAGQPIMESALNYEQFSGRTVLNQSELNRAPQEQVNEYTAPAAEWVARVMGGNSPAKVEHYINGYFPGFGRQALDFFARSAGEAIGRGPSIRSIQRLKPDAPDERRKFWKNIRGNIVGRALNNLRDEAFTIRPPWGSRSRSVRKFKEEFYDMSPLWGSFNHNKNVIANPESSAQQKQRAISRMKEDFAKWPSMNPKQKAEAEIVVNEINDRGKEIRDTLNNLRLSMEIADKENWSNSKRWDAYYKSEEKMMQLMKEQTYLARRHRAYWSSEEGIQEAREWQDTLLSAWEGFVE